MLLADPRLTRAEWLASVIPIGLAAGQS